MKILKAGKLPEETVLRGKCPYCGCEVEATRGECKRSPGEYQMGPDSHWVKCPTPGCVHNIPMNGRDD